MDPITVHPAEQFHAFGACTYSVFYSVFWYYLYLNGHLLWRDSFCACMFTSATICIVVSILFRVKLVFSVLCQRPSSCFAAKSWTMCVLLRVAVWVVHCKTYGSWSSAVKMLQVGSFYCAFFMCWVDSSRCLFKLFIKFSMWTSVFILFEHF